MQTDGVMPDAAFDGDSSAARLLLFDIDGTLLDCGHQTRGIVARALEETFETTPPLEGYSFAGRTDLGILFDLMQAAGHDEPEIAELIPAMKQRYLEGLEEGLKTADMRLLPGADELLSRLEQQGRHTLGLLTGNWEQGAKIKLSRFGLDRYFAFGGFGDVSRHRIDLVPAALEAARQTAGVEYELEQVVLIGDSVLDVECALHHNVDLIAVDTGGTTALALRRAGAERVASSLHEVGRWIDRDFG